MSRDLQKNNLKILRTKPRPLSFFFLETVLMTSKKPRAFFTFNLLIIVTD